MILASGPDLTEGIDYKMLSYRDDRGIAIALNAQKHYVSLYVGDIHKIDPDRPLVERPQFGEGLYSVLEDQSDLRDRHRGVYRACA